jgi:hypothetical protein
MALAERVDSGLTQETDPDLAKVLRWDGIAEASTAETVHRETAMESYKFYAGDQDTQEVKDELIRQNRPVSVYNEIKPKIDMLVGIAGQSKYETTTVPVGAEDEALSELLNNTILHFRTVLGASNKELDCFEHTVKSGRSMLYFYVNTDNPFKPEIKLKRVPTYNFKIDPDSREFDCSDAKYAIIDSWLPADEIKAKWKGFDPEKFGTSTIINNINYPLYYNEAKERYRVSECWYYNYEDVVYFINPFNGKDESLTPEEFKKFVFAISEGIKDENGEVMEVEPPQGYPSIKKVLYFLTFCGDLLLEKGKSPYQWESFPFALYGAYKNEDSNSWFSSIEAMKDPQKSLNTTRRQLTHLLQVLPKGILAQEVGTILNIDEYEKRSADPTFWLEVAQGGLDKFKFITQPGISPIYQHLDSTFQQSIKDSSGIQDSLLGIQTTGREAGVTLRGRQETGFAVLFTLYDNLSKSRLLGGKILLSFIQQFVTLPTMIRIGGGKAASLVEINNQINPEVEGFNDITAGKYDLVMEESIETNTMRAATGQALIDFSHNSPGSIPPDVILEYMNIPFTAKEKVKEYHAAVKEQEQENIEADREIEMLKITSSNKVSKKEEK